MNAYRCTCPQCEPPGRYPDPYRPRPRPVLPVIQDDTPILATRGARIRRAPRNVFGSVNGSSRNSWWGVESTARCRKRLRHARCPSPDCTCGFYAVPADRRHMFQGPQYVQLDVELAGRVIIHSGGYRAEWQRVLAVRIDPCHRCGDRRSRYVEFPRHVTRSPWIFCPCTELPGQALRTHPIERVLETLPVPWTLEGEDP